MVRVWGYSDANGWNQEENATQNELAHSGIFAAFVSLSCFLSV
jgi:hypothetical protein